MQLRSTRLTAIASAVKKLFSPLSLFANNEQGVWYDPSDVNLTWRKNLLTYTEQFDNFTWTKTRASVTANAVIAPDSTLTADKLVENTDTNSHFINQNATVSLGIPITYSIYAKKGERNYMSIFCLGTTAAANTFFDLSNGVIVSTSTNAISSIQNIGNGWYRCTVTATTNATTTGIYPGISVDGVNSSYTGDGTSGIYIWGAQLEVGSTSSTYQSITDGVQDYYAYQAQPVLFQDSAGTTPVTAVEQPVGLMLDKSKGLVLGSELVTNGDFSSGTADWTNRSTGAGTFSVSGGAAVVTGVDGTSRGWFTQTRTTVVGAYYKIAFDYTHTSGTVNLIFGSTSGTGSLSLTSSGQKTIYLVASSTATFIGFQTASGGGNGTIDNISVRELPGNHAFQTTSTSRPVLSARYNLLTKTEQFDDVVAWTRTGLQAFGSGSVANATTAPDGTQTADLLIESTASGNHRVIQSAGTLAPQRIQVSVRHKAGIGVRNLDLAITSGSGNFVSNWFSTTTGQTLSENDSFGSVFSGKQVTVSGPDAYGFFTATISVNILVASTISVLFGLVNETNNYVGNGTSGIYIWGADLRVTNDAAGQPAYQRVNTATDYDTAGFKPYLRFDGTDDWLQTNSINFTATDKMTVFAGVRKLSDAVNYGMVSELGADAPSGAFTVLAPHVGATYSWLSKGTSGAFAVTGTTYASPTTNIICGIGNISGDSSILRINGIPAAERTDDQGTGNYGNYPLYIGRRGGTTLPFNGRFYGLIVRGAQSTAQQITSTENWLNQRTGAY